MTIKIYFMRRLICCLQLNENEHMTWNGKFRSALDNAEIAPRPIQQRLPMWIGVGGTPASAELAGKLGTGMTLAILGGDPAKFKHLVDTYRAAGLKANHQADKLKLAITGHGYIARHRKASKG